MKLYLSSYGIGNSPAELKALIKDGRRVAMIGNARDFKTAEERSVSLRLDEKSLLELGLEVAEIDLRNFFGKSEGLEQALTKFDLVWIPGGNVFILRQAFKLSGFDNLIQKLIKSDRIVYGGYSAGVCVLGPTLEGIDIVDPPDIFPDGYNKEVTWDGLGLLAYSVAPHYDSDHPESEDINRYIEYLKDKKLPYKALRDGEVIVINGYDEKLITLRG